MYMENNIKKIQLFFFLGRGLSNKLYSFSSDVVVVSLYYLLITLNKKKGKKDKGYKHKVIF